jgi:pimeloyl-ACP methyl ester carboxylesterase
MISPPMSWALTHVRSPVVVNWEPSSLPIQRHGPLVARAAGEGADAVVLLHGLISTGDVFGAVYVRLAGVRRLFVPDLLGFGRSMDVRRRSFPVEAHLEALDQCAAGCGLLASTRWTIGAHSMGSALALRWAVRHRDRVVRVVCWGAPVHRSPDAALARLSGSTMARLFAFDTEMASRACAVSCRHRTVAGWLSVLAEPRLPVPVARAAPLHTWPAYRDAVRHLVIDTDWDGVITACADAGIETRLVWGDRDRIGDRTRALEIASGAGLTTVVTISGADHRLPMTHPQTCINQLTDHRLGD